MELFTTERFFHIFYKNHLFIKNVVCFRTVDKVQNWNKVLNLKEKEERLKEINMDIASEKFLSDAFRQKFLILNSKWLRENLKFVFTPRTLKL